MSGIIGGGENSSGIIGKHGLVPQKWSAARMTQSSTISVGSNTWVKLIYNAVPYDELGEIGSSRFTAKYAGIYNASAVLRASDFAWTAAQGLYIAIRINGTEQITKRTNAGGSFTSAVNVSLSGDFSLAIGGYIEFWVHQQTAGTQNVGTGASYNNSSIHRVA